MYDPTLGEQLLDKVGEGEFTKETMLGALGPKPSSYQWRKVRQSCAAAGVLLRWRRDIGLWSIRAEGNKESAGALQNWQELDEMFTSGLRREAILLVQKVQDPKLLVTALADRGINPMNLGFKFMANGLPDEVTQIYLETVKEVSGELPAPMVERHKEVVGLLSTIAG